MTGKSTGNVDRKGRQERPTGSRDRKSRQERPTGKQAPARPNRGQIAAKLRPNHSKIAAKGFSGVCRRGKIAAKGFPRFRNSLRTHEAESFGSLAAAKSRPNPAAAKSRPRDFLGRALQVPGRPGTCLRAGQDVLSQAKPKASQGTPKASQRQAKGKPRL